MVPFVSHSFFCWRGIEVIGIQEKTIVSVVSIVSVVPLV